MDAAQIVLKILSDIQLIEESKPSVITVCEFMWDEIEKYLWDLPSCLTVDKSIVYSYFVVGSVLRNIIKYCIEQNMPDCGDCAKSRYSFNHGGP